MSKEHLTYFKVENFKRFDSLELTDIGQFNLVVGDNNVGKTSLLEALSVLSRRNQNNSFDSLQQNLNHVLLMRGVDVKANVDFFLKYLAKEENKPIIFDFVIDNKRKYVTFKKLNPEQITIERRVLPPETESIPESQNVSIGGGLKNSTILPLNIEPNPQLYKEYQDTIGLYRRNKHLITDNLKVIDSHIAEIEVLPILEQSHIMIGFDNTDLYMPITGLGESAVRIFYYLLHIIQNQSQRLMLDEIDTGIHYSRMKNFLKTIFQIADKNDVQLFMTTHSLECQEAFAEVFEAPDMVQHQSKARQFTLIEKPDGQVEAIKRNWEQLEFALQTDNETRGGKQVW